MKGRRHPDQRDRELGAELRRLRKARNLTQAFVAEAIGLTPQQYSKYERGLSRMAMSLYQQVMEVIAPPSDGHFSEEQAAFKVEPAGIRTLMSESIARMRAELDHLDTIVSRL